MARISPYHQGGHSSFGTPLTYALYTSISPPYPCLPFTGKRLFGRERLDRLLLRTPLVGKVGFYFNLSRFAYTLYMTLLSAVPITSAFRIAVGSISNAYMRERLGALAGEIERGRSLSWVLKSSRSLPSTVPQPR
ncbi:MAG: hypothetical protein Q9N34_02900 [Aquificota bacterium]|nr:hypothetical protein [Aquificota bacterium]